MSIETYVVHGLVGLREVSTAARCWRSLQEYSSSKIDWVIHDDGTLQSEQKESLSSAIRISRWISCEEADDVMAEVLRGRPRCWQFRTRAAYAKKLFDGPQFANQNIYCFADSDILCFRPYRGLWDALERNACDFVFINDDANSYTARPWHVLRPTGVDLVAGINVGIIIARKSLCDLDYLEWFLGKDWGVFWKYPWLEQTCWAALAARGTCKLIEPKQIRVVTGKEPVPGRLIAGHFTSDVRGRLTEVSEGSANNSNPECIKLIPSRRLSAIDLAYCQVKRGILRRCLL